MLATKESRGKKRVSEKAKEMGHRRRFRVEISPLESSLKRNKRNKMGERAGACRHRFPFPRLLRLCNLLLLLPLCLLPSPLSSSSSFDSLLGSRRNLREHVPHTRETISFFSRRCGTPFGAKEHLGSSRLSEKRATRSTFFRTARDLNED